MNEWNDLDSMNVWKNETQFDYSVWENGVARLKLCTVPWDRMYEHIVAWESDEARDEYFRNLEGYTWEEETGWNFKSLEVFKPGLGKHEGLIPVELPYEAAMNYNFLFVELYEQPVPGQPGNRREVFFYFLTSLNKISPSDTNLYLELDTVTTYFNSITIEALNLHRGHYPHAQTSASKFLENPLENSFGLTEIEPDLPDLKPVVSHTQLISYSKNGPRICVATTGDFTDRRSWFTVIPKDESDDPDARQVSFPAAGQPGKMSAPWNPPFDKDRGGYEEYDSTYLKPSVKQQSNGRGTTEGLNVYSMAPQDFPAFIAYARQSMQQILPTIQAVYVLDSAVIDEADQFTQWGFSFKVVRQSSSPKLLESLHLDESHFDYDDLAKGFAKLYTSQFAKLEITNYQGERAEIAIEEIAETLSFYSRASSLFPFLKLEALIDGVGGRGVKTYTVKPLGAVEATEFLSQWDDYRFDLDVPIYSIRVDKAQEVGQVSAMKRKAAARAAKVRQDTTKTKAEREWLNASNVALAARVARSNEYTKDYNNAMANISLNYENRSREIQTAYSIAFATTGKDYDNAIRSITTEYQNAMDSASTELANAGRSASKDRDNAEDSASTESGNAGRSNQTGLLNAKESADLPYDYWYDTEKAITTSTYLQKFDWDTNLWKFTWDRKYDLYLVMKAAAQATGGMSILTSARVAGYGAIGSGIASLPAGSIGAGFDTGFASPAIDGIGAFSPGAVAGIAIANIVQQAIAVEVNAAIWEFQVKQNNITNASYASEFMELNGTTFYYEGRGVKAQEWYTTERTAHESFLVQQFKWTLDYNNEITLRDDIENRRKDLAYSVAERSAWATGQNISDSYANSVVIAGRSYNAAIANSSASYETAVNVNLRSRNAGTANADANLAQARANATMEQEKATQIMNDVKTIGIQIAERNQFTADTNSYLQYMTELTTNEKTRELTDFQADVDYGLDRAQWTSDFLSEVQGDPSVYGQDGGRAENDIWGLRGISVRVRRCSDAVARQAAGIFSRYGYNTGGIWVEKPNLTPMTDFCYWKADSVWILGDRINETNKEIFRRLFERGVTIWTDPTLIFRTKLADNRPA